MVKAGGGHRELRVREAEALALSRHCASQQSTWLSSSLHQKRSKERSRRRGNRLDDSVLGILGANLIYESDSL